MELLLQDQYRTLAEPSEGFLKEKGSKFLAYAFPISDEASINVALGEIRSLHPKSRHHCYAWKLGYDGNQYRANDDGEPSGTAGRPILGQLESFEITDALVIVVRYFGGTLLGASGLIKAYREAARLALDAAPKRLGWITESYVISFDYALMSQVMNAVKRLDLVMESQDFNASAKLTVAIRKSEIMDTLLKLTAYIGELHLEEVTEETKVEGLAIEPLTEK